MFLLLFFQAHMYGIICRMKHSWLLFAKTKGTGSLEVTVITANACELPAEKDGV